MFVLSIASPRVQELYRTVIAIAIDRDATHKTLDKFIQWDTPMVDVVDLAMAMEEKFPVT